LAIEVRQEPADGEPAPQRTCRLTANKRSGASPFGDVSAKRGQIEASASQRIKKGWSTGQ